MKSDLSNIISSNNLTLKQCCKPHLKGLLHVDGLLGRRLEVGDLILAVAPLLSPLGRHLGKNQVIIMENLINIGNKIKPHFVIIHRFEQLGWVDLDLSCSIICLVLLRLMGKGRTGWANW